MIPFSGGTIVDQTFVSNGTKTQLIAQWVAAVAAAGWTLVSGSGSDVTYDSAPTPQGFQIRFRVLDVGGATQCAKFIVGSNILFATDAKFLLPVNGNTFRVWANPYQFAIFMSGISSPGRDVVFGGCPWVPDFLIDYLHSSGYNYYGFSAGTANSDTTNDAGTSWRSSCFNAGLRNMAWITRNYALNFSGSLHFLGRGYYNSTFLPRGPIGSWDDGTWVLEEAIINFLQGTGSGTSFCSKGVLWDAILCFKGFDSEVVRLLGGGAWRCVTHQGIGTLLLLTNAGSPG
jgi:hypothetical protein